MTIALTILWVVGLVGILVLSLLLYRRSTNPGFLILGLALAIMPGISRFITPPLMDLVIESRWRGLPLPFSFLAEGATEPTEVFSRIFLFMSVVSVLLIVLGFSLLAFLKPSTAPEGTTAGLGELAGSEREFTF